MTLKWNLGEVLKGILSKESGSPFFLVDVRNEEDDMFVLVLEPIIIAEGYTKEGMYQEMHVSWSGERRILTVWQQIETELPFSEFERSILFLNNFVNHPFHGFVSKSAIATPETAPEKATCLILRTCFEFPVFEGFPLDVKRAKHLRETISVMTLKTLVELSHITMGLVSDYVARKGN